MVRFLQAALLSISISAATAAPIVIKADRMFDGRDMVSPGLVVVDNGKIVAVGKGAKIPEHARILDFGDATISPGFIDAHTHLSMPAIGDFRQDIVDSLQMNIPERALRAGENTRKTLWVGITTVRDVGSADFIDVGLRNAINAGKIVGPRMLVSVHALGATGGHCDDQSGYRYGVIGPEWGPEQGVINSADDARRAVRFNIKYGANVIKTCATGGVLSLTDDVDTPQLTQDELNALVSEAHALRRKTAAHAHGVEGAKRAIRAGIDSIEHGTFLDDETLDLMKSRGTYLVPTLMATQGGRERIGKGLYDPRVEVKVKAAIAAIDNTMRKAISKGVKIGMGTDAAVYPHGRNMEEFHMMVDLGMKPIDALRAGASADADLLGWSSKIGTLEPGKFADIIVMPGDPTKDIRQVEKVFFVMKEGEIYRNDKP